MNLFPVTPPLTPAHRKRLAPHISNAGPPLRQWLATRPSLDDLKRALMLEVEHAKADYNSIQSIKRGVFDALLRRIQQEERSIIDAKAHKELNL